MPEFVNTGKGMQLVETNNASQVPFQRGNLIIEDSGSIYYDPTNKTDVSGRITVGKADEIVDLGLIEGDTQVDDGAILLDVLDQGIYKYRVTAGTEEEQEYLINAYNMRVRATTQFRFTYNSLYIRLLEDVSNDGVSVPWTKFATTVDVPKVIDALTSTNPTKDALSVNQGNILDSKVDDVAADLTTHENKNATTAQRGHVQLVNDLTTGGTDKALTAEQGKQLKTALDSIELIESLGTVTSPLTDANVFRTTTTAGIYNFTAGGEIGYLIVGGQNNGAQTTQYLFFDNDFYSRESTSASSWGTWNKCLQSADIINNLTSGGTNVPLSAEQGKVLSTNKADKSTTLAGYGITNAYTKTEVDSKLSSVYKYIGSVAVDQLPQNLTASDKGNVYNLTNDGTINASTEHEETVVAGDNVAWTGDYWDKLAGTIIIPEGSMIQRITSGSANDINDEGLYYVNSTVTNLPDSSISTGRWFLICATSSTGSSQTAYSPVGTTYRRIKSGAMGSWESWQDITFYKSSTGDVTIGGKVNTTGTRDAGNVVIGSGTTTVGDNGVIIGSASEITGTNNKNSIAIGYEAVAAANGAIQIGHGTNNTANTTQIGEYPLLDATGKIVEDRLPGRHSKKYSTIVIGNSASGLTTNDVDYLYTSGQDFKTILEQAVNSLPSTGGEIKILSGTYNISSAVALSRPVRLYGENGTIFSVDNVDASISSSSELKLYNLEVDFSSNISSVNGSALLIFNNNTANNSICNCTFKTSGVSPKESPFIHAAGKINISNNTFYSLNIANTSPITVNSGSLPAIISNNVFSFSSESSLIVDTAGSSIQPYIVNNYIDATLPTSWYTVSSSIPTIGMNMFKNGIDKLVFANEEEMGGGSNS